MLARSRGSLMRFSFRFDSLTECLAAIEQDGRS